MSRNSWIHWTRKQFESLPSRKWDEQIDCLGIVILPLRKKHDSGYRCMDFIAVDRERGPFCKLSGCSDVIHIDGIGGFGRWNPESGIPRLIPPAGWCIDCLPESGLLFLWPSGKTSTCMPALSSFEIYANHKEKA